MLLSLIWLVQFVCTFVCWFVVKNDTIFDTVTLRQYLTFLQPRIFVAVLLVRLVLMVANSLYFSFLFLGRFNPSPTLPIGVETAANV
jgi:hypothetical protein